MSFRFVPNPAFTLQVAREPLMAAFLEEEAQVVKAGAESVSPVDTGLYKSSFDTEIATEHGGFVARVTNSAPYWLYIEFGTSDTPTFQPLRKGLELAHLRRG